MNVFLLAAERAAQAIKVGYPEAFEVCQKAIQNCRDWLNGKIVAPEILAAYLDADETENPWMQESVFKDDPDSLHAMIFVTMIVGHFAHFAYIRADRTEWMSEVIAEAGENIIESIIDYGKQYGLLKIENGLPTV